MHQATPAMFRDVLPWRTFRWFYGQRHYSGSYWASTMAAHVIYESRLELARLLLADFETSVNHIVAQPFMIHGRLCGKIRHHIPDYLLLTADGPVVVDVKRADLLDDHAVAETFEWVRVAVAAMGWSFEVASEQPRVMMDNVRFLAGFRRRTSINDSALSQLRTQRLDGASVGEAIRGVQGAEPLARAALLHMLWTRELLTDLSVVLSSESVLSAPSSS
ncbi:TnsA-like heteromeric transposase endonuclease subunit [Mycolicibacterium sp. YH-1]|uniref:TnsA-like heteromeric transposase endonuclease subunit n=1 Tax=Mycolicibacterium sp. YH-1 TaxID=2908837 RepID=UPI001F4C025B|nr:TnsA-like heteromeric transposase endonuclease subunit [Mycolicibacterium sp. YH-1]UNB52865.1 TnsA-like heteromeric transposase endonuclease subunit [Mycolicibacterium sp. YH-1]